MLSGKGGSAVHFTLARKGGFVYAPRSESKNVCSVAFRHLFYHFGANFTDYFSVVYAEEVIKEK